MRKNKDESKQANVDPCHTLSYLVVLLIEANTAPAANMDQY